jgi:hypothetical protein
MEVLEQSEVAADVRVSETEARVLFLAMRYWEEAMDTGSPLVEDLSTRLEKISAEFDAVLEKARA